CNILTINPCTTYQINLVVTKGIHGQPDRLCTNFLKKTIMRKVNSEPQSGWEASEFHRGIFQRVTSLLNNS
ncbi:MAG: hypothetical protein AB8G86_00525, partial [Saprospiraceae bacterium]